VSCARLSQDTLENGKRGAHPQAYELLSLCGMRAIAWASALALGLSGCGGETFNDGSAGDAGSIGSGAVGGTGGGGGGSGGTGAAGSGGAAASPSLEGSYDLSFDSVTPEPQFAGSPSAGSTARLDVRQSDTGYDAVFCARWGDAAVYSFQVGSNEVTLMGDGRFRGTNVDETWSSILLRLGANGFSGTMTATGTNEVMMGDTFSVSDVSATGRVSSDALPPEFDQIIEVAPFLPWDAIRLEAAEPVDSAELMSHTTVGTRSVAWSAAPEPEIGSEWVGITRLTGYFTNWDPGAAELPPYAVRIAAGVRDRAGHASIDFVGSDFEPLSVGAPQSVYSFDGADTIGRWGNTLLLGGTASDPRCESGGCVSIEFENQYCASGPAGIAVRLLGSAANVRYRLIVHDALSADGKPTWVPVAFRLETAVPGAPSQTSYPPDVDWSQLQPYTDPVQQLPNRWATPWSTLSVTSGVQTSEIGLAVHAGGYSGCSGGGPAPPPVNTTILIDQIDAS
jgi:hypothetical protein